MPHSDSARKRLRQNQKRNLRNRATRSELKSCTKKVLVAIEAKDLSAAQSLLRAAQTKLDKAARRNIVHRNTASRRKSLLARKVAELVGAK